MNASVCFGYTETWINWNGTVAILSFSEEYLPSNPVYLSCKTAPATIEAKPQAWNVEIQEINIACLPREQNLRETEGTWPEWRHLPPSSSMEVWTPK